MSLNRHPFYLRREARWRQWLECWRGGEYFRAASLASVGGQRSIESLTDASSDAPWLWSHPRESNADYLERAVRSSFRRYAGFALDVLAAGVTEGVAPPKTRLPEGWLSRCTRDAQDIATYRRSVAVASMIFGHVWLAADKREEDPDGEPYLYVVSPLDLIDWSVERDTTLAWALVREVLSFQRPMPGTGTPRREATSERYRLWTPEYSQLLDAYGKPLGEQRVNALGRVPLEFVCRTRDPWTPEPAGIADMADLAPVNLREYNLRSLRDRILTDTCFPFLAIARAEGESRLAPEQQVELGTDRAVVYDARGGPPLWVQPSPESVDTITAQIREDVQTIRELAGLRIANEDSAAGISAEALRLIRANLDARFASHAAQLQDAELRVLTMAQELAGLGTDGVESVWPSDYGAQESGGRLDDIARALNMGLSESPAAAAELRKSAFASVLPGLPARTMRAVTAELEAPAAKSAALNGAQLASLLEIVRSASAGEIPAESAVQMILMGLPVDEAAARAVIGDAGVVAEERKAEEAAQRAAALATLQARQAPAQGQGEDNADAADAP